MQAACSKRGGKTECQANRKRKLRARAWRHGTRFLRFPRSLLPIRIDCAPGDHARPAFLVCVDFLCGNQFEIAGHADSKDSNRSVDFKTSFFERHC